MAAAEPCVDAELCWSKELLKFLLAVDLVEAVGMIQPIDWINWLSDRALRSIATW